jgi:hypothetical protein
MFYQVSLEIEGEKTWLEKADSFASGLTMSCYEKILRQTIWAPGVIFDPSNHLRVCALKHINGTAEQRTLVAELINEPSICFF